MACVAVASLVRTLELEFLQPQPPPVIVQQNELISANKELMKSLCQKLESLMDQFDEKRMDGVEAIKHLERKLRDVAFGVEDVVELLVVDLYEAEEIFNALYGEKEICNDLYEAEKIFNYLPCEAHPCLKLRCIMQQAIEEIDQIKEKLVNAKKEYEHVTNLQGKNTPLGVLPRSDEVVMMGSSSPQNASQSEDILVGKENEFKTIMHMLIEDQSKEREVISIEGTGGIGKTTLARRVYEDPSIASHFDKRGWVVASQNHNKRQMFEGLLKSMGSEESGTDEELALRLYQSLRRQRYLVVIDDVWGGEALDAVKACFPDDENGSRVLLTTRLAEVVKYTGSKNDFSHQMHLLDQRESWNLFRKKMPLEGDEFEAIAKQIVAKCKGLPLAIVVVAGLFSKLDTLDEWKNVAKDLNSSSTNIAKACSQILSLSYNHLSHNLKACFLYLGVFPEDKVINAPNLCRLWIAEGLVKAFENESFESVAERHIQELSDRNLIMVSERSSCKRKIKAFRVHDMLHAFCVNEARNENLLHIVNDDVSNFPEQGFRWLSIQSSHFDGRTSKCCRSIFSFRNISSSSTLDFQTFQLLRVLCIHDFQGMQRNLVGLVHLRYLSCKFSLIVLKPERAWKLQTLDAWESLISYIFDGPHLRYLRSKYGLEKLCPKFFQLYLQSISRLAASDCTMDFVTDSQFLKRVSIYCYGGGDIDDCLETLVYLQQLESLTILACFERDILPINKIVPLKNLRKLTIRGTNYPWNEINILCRLPELKVLKLENHNSYYYDEEWELTEGVKFCKLLFLRIASTALQHWNTFDGNFPKLERLHLSKCGKLKNVPDCFGEVPTLKSIELTSCLRAAVRSAKKIQEDQHDYGNKDMVVIEAKTIYSLEDDSSGED